MKRIVLSLLAVACFSLVNAQTKALQTAKINTPSVQCEMCKARIEQYLKRIDGVTYVNVVPKKKETNVKFLSDRTNLEVIKTAIANTGYDVGKTAEDGSKMEEIEIAANPDFYKLLPKCCKKPEDGGGMPKN